MAVRTVTRRGKRRLVIDIRFRKPDGTRGRYRHDAQVQTIAAAHAEERRRLMMLATTGSPYEASAPSETAAITKAGAAEESKPSGALFEDVAKQYIDHYAPSRLKPSTMFGYKAIINNLLIPRIGTLPIGAIDATVGRNIDGRLVDRGVTVAYRRNVQAVLRSILGKYAIEAKLLAKAPEFPVLPKVGRKVLHTLTSEEIRTLLAHANPVHRLAFMLAAYAGLRSGEVRGLKWCDVDLKRGILTVRRSMCHGIAAAPKSGHERIVPLTDELRNALINVKSIDPNAPVTTSLRGKAWGETSIYRAFKSVLRRAQLGDWRVHDLRHYFVTALFRSGVSAPTVQALAGHERLSTTEIYAHVAAVDLHDAIAKLGKQTG